MVTITNFAHFPWSRVPVSHGKWQLDTEMATMAYNSTCDSWQMTDTFLQLILPLVVQVDSNTPWATARTTIRLTKSERLPFLSSEELADDGWSHCLLVMGEFITSALTFVGIEASVNKLSHRRYFTTRGSHHYVLRTSTCDSSQKLWSPNLVLDAWSYPEALLDCLQVSHPPIH